jgi:hypothetical protein
MGTRAEMVEAGLLTDELPSIGNGP